MFLSGLTLAEDGTVQAIEDVATKMEGVENGANIGVDAAGDQKELFVADEHQMIEEEKPKLLEQKEEYVDQTEYVSSSLQHSPILESPSQLLCPVL